MTKMEALNKIQRLNEYPDLRAELVRILPEEIDPPKDNDNGWDVLITVIESGE